MEPYQDETRPYQPIQEQSTPVPPAQEQYSAPQPEPWREPVYTEPVYYANAYSPTRRGSGYGEAYARHQERPKASRPMTRAGAAWLVVACCLLCSALGGTAGWMAAQKAAEENTPTQVYLGGNSADQAAAVSAAPTANPGGLQPSDIYNMALRQVVGISTEISANVFGQNTSSAVSGTGFLISSDGYILTNYHVIEYAALHGGEMTVMFYDGSTHAASVVGYEDDNDIAVIKIDAAELEPVTFCSSMTVGENVYVVGNPLGELTYTMTRGCLSALDRVITTDSYSAVNMFQIDAAVNSGNSGGPVYNAAGQVIGIVSAKYASAGVEGIGFAIPIEDAVSIATQLIENGYVAGKAYLGVSVEDVTEAVAAYFNMPVGAYVNSVTAGSAAENAGMRTGDIITAMDDAAVTSVADLKAALKTYHAGDAAAVTVYRSGEFMTLEVILDEDVPKT
ncbi:MAG: trypsin-like peptidase domain-containing protein [Oscillospiraceae bacterium]|nr:trypsin-like peptidase domain-containing protein [Oscillospiraceae bacterium]